jgi:hypothetical protein
MVGARSEASDVVRSGSTVHGVRARERVYKAASLMRRLSSFSWRALTLAASAFVSGCHSYRLETAPVPRGADVRVRLDPPRDLVLAVPGADSVRIAAVSRIDGGLMERRGDTVRIAPRRIRSENEPLPRWPAGRATVDVILPRGRPLEVRELARGRTALAIGTTAAVVVLLMALIALASADYGLGSG